MNVPYKKVTSISLKEQVIRELEKSIFSGALQPGDRLPPEREIAAAMGISRSLINVCILELESRGFVRIVPRHGTFVNDYKKQGTPQMLLSLMNFDSERMDSTLCDNVMATRRLIECECTRLAVQNASEPDFDRMRKALDMMENPQDEACFINGNFQFHHALTIASGNVVYAMIFNSFEHAIRFFLRLFFDQQDRCIASVQTHRALLTALENRNEPAALDAIALTLDTGIAGLSDILKQ